MGMVKGSRFLVWRRRWMSRRCDIDIINKIGEWLNKANVISGINDLIKGAMIQENVYFFQIRPKTS